MVADVPRNMSLRRFPGSNVLSYYVIIIFIYNYTNNGVTSVCIDLAKIKLFVFAFVFVTPHMYSRAVTPAHPLPHTYSHTVTPAQLLWHTSSRAPIPAHLLPHSYTRTVTPAHLLPQVQLGPRYEGQLNHMAEPIPHPVSPLVLPRDTHQRRTETDRLTLTEADAHCASFYRYLWRRGWCMPWAPYDHLIRPPT